MAKQPRPTDSGLPRRRPGRALDAAQDDAVVATKGPTCGHRSNDHGVDYVCVKNPGHLGDHTPVRADGVIATYLDPDPTTDTLPAATSSPPGVAAPEVDPTPATPGAPTITPEPSDAGLSVAESPGSGGSGSGRPTFPATVAPALMGMVKAAREYEETAAKVAETFHTPHTTRSIGRPIANTAIDAALGVPVELQDERAHAREAVEILVEAAAEHHRHNQFMPVARLLDLEAVIRHMVDARGVGR